MASSLACLLETEIHLLQRILFKQRNQHKSTVYYRKLRHFCSVAKKLIPAGKPLDQTALSKLLGLSVEVYLLMKGMIFQTHFLPLAITCMAIVARVRFLFLRLARDGAHTEDAAGGKELDFFATTVRTATGSQVDHDAELDDILGFL